MSAQMETFQALNHTGLREIVVSIDDSTSARRAVATAVQIAMRLGLQLHLVTVHRSNGTGAETAHGPQRPPFHTQEQPPGARPRQAQGATRRCAD